MASIGYATLSVIPSARGFGSALSRSVGPEISSVGTEQGRSFGGAMVGALGKVVKTASIGAAIFGGLALKSGLDRLTTIENATSSLTTIMGDAGKAAAFMGEIKKTVNGTPFNLDQFATVGKNLVAMNVPAAKVPGYLTAIGEAAAVSGKGAEGVNAVADAFGKMAAQGKVSLDQVWSISDTGVPALQILANGFGVTTDEMQKMISKGAVPADKAMDLLANGIVKGSDGAAGATIALGGSMAGLRKTFDGSFGGMKAAVARFGAAVLGPFIPLITSAMTGVADLVDRLAPKFQAMATKVSAAIAGVTAILFQGDFTAAFGQAFGLSEDSAVVDWLFRIREGFMAAKMAVSDFWAGATLADPASFSEPFEGAIGAGVRFRAVLDTVKDAIVGTYDLVVNGDFTSAFARAFNVQEDSPVVGKILDIRDSVSELWTSLSAVDTSSFSSAIGSVQASAGPLGDTFSAIKASTSGLPSAIGNLGSALGDMGSGGGQIASNLINVLAGSLGFFADHTTLATAAIVALSAGFLASGPVMEAYRYAYIVRTPLIVVQTAVQWANTRALAASTAATVGNAGAQTATMGAKARAIALTVGDTVKTAANTVVKYASIAATWAGATATEALGAAMKFALGPVGLIIAGIALLVAGLVWFFTQTDAGRAIVTAAWDGIKAAASAVVDWFTGTALPALQSVWAGISAGAMWLWTSVLQPVWAGISAGFGATVGFISAAWTNVLSPVFQLVAAVALWLWQEVLAIAFAAIKLEWSVLVTSISWFWTNVLSPVFSALAALALWLWDSVLRPTWAAMQAGWSLLLLGIQAAWTNVLSPVLSAVGTAAQFMWNSVVSPVLAAMGGAWDLLLRGMKVVYDGVLSPVFSLLGTAVGTAKGAFDTGVSGIKSAWDKLMEIAKAPVKFVVETVLNNGLIAGFNKLAAFFSTSGIPPIPLPAGFARGGILPGSSSWRAGDDQLVPMRRGEGVYVSEAMADPYERARLSAVNAAAMGGRSLAGFQGGLARGGLVGERDAGGPLDAIGGLVSAAWDFAKDPIGTLKSGVEQLFGGIGSSPFAKLVAAAPAKILDAAVGKVRSLLAGSMSPDGEVMPAPASGATPAGGSSVWQRAFNTVQAAFPQARVNSAFRPGDPGFHGRGMAVDLGQVGRSGGIGHPYLAAMNQWIADNFPGSRELIYDGLGDNRPDLKNGRPLNYGAATNAQHRNHVHWVPPALGFDSGGYLPEGVSTVYNGTGSQEPLMRVQQPRQLGSDVLAAAGGGGWNPTVNIYPPAQVSSPGELADELVHKLRVMSRGGVYAGSSA